MIVVAGLSHRTAPIELRERLALPAERVGDALAELRQLPGVDEVMLLSTCNRVEVVAAGADEQRVAESLREWLLGRVPSLGAHLYVHHGARAVRHLFRVACSLDSLVVGEPQILGQLKAAFETARAARTLGPRLYRVFPRAVRAAKRARTETSLGSGQVSVPSVAVLLARQIFGELAGRRAVLVGAGDMAETTGRALAAAGARVEVVGRNAERTRALAERVGGVARGWDELRDSVVQADVVITSTSAPHHVIEHDLVLSARKVRRGRALFFVDLAVPRDVDPRVGDLGDVFLYNVDDLSRVVAESQSGREREAERAEIIVAEEAAGWERWADGESATPTIKALRQRMGETLAGELERSLHGRLRHLSDQDRDALRVMADAALNKMLHEPTLRLRAAASDPSESWRAPELARVLSELFGLDAEVLHTAHHDPHPTGREPKREDGAVAPARAARK